VGGGGAGREREGRGTRQLLLKGGIKTEIKVEDEQEEEECLSNAAAHQIANLHKDWRRGSRGGGKVPASS
jgi:hypothetical protein